MCIYIGQIHTPAHPIFSLCLTARIEPDFWYKRQFAMSVWFVRHSVLSKGMCTLQKDALNSQNLQ